MSERAHPASGDPYHGWSAAPGVLELHLTYSPLAYLNSLATPRVTIGGYPVPYAWGVQLIQLPAGQHDVHVTFPYLFFDACPARLYVPIYPSHKTSVLYEAPYFRFMNGSMKVLQIVPG
jgi:hypothetical protein